MWTNLPLDSTTCSAGRIVMVLTSPLDASTVTRRFMTLITVLPSTTTTTSWSVSTVYKLSTTWLPFLCLTTSTRTPLFGGWYAAACCSIENSPIGVNSEISPDVDSFPCASTEKDIGARNGLNRTWVCVVHPTIMRRAGAIKHVE